MDPVHPLVHVGIVGATHPGGAHDIAPRPLTLAKYAGASQQTIDSFTVSQADIFLAPLGGTTASGESILPGLSVKFDGKIVDTTIHVSAAVALTPTPRIDANIHFGALQLGSIRIADTYLNLHAGTDGFSFQFTGGFSDRGITSSASVTLNASTSSAGGRISLSIVGGLPTYVYANGSRNGSVYASGSGVSFSASGYGSLYVAGIYEGSVSFSYSADSGMLWQQITGTAQKLASDLKTYYNYSATQVQQALTSLQWNSYRVVAAINSVGHYGQQFVDAVTNLFHTNREFIWNGVVALDVSGA